MAPTHKGNSGSVTIGGETLAVGDWEMVDDATPREHLDDGVPPKVVVVRVWSHEVTPWDPTTWWLRAGRQDA